MKKVRLNLKRGVKSWSFVLYDSAESAFYLKDEPFYGDDVDEYRKVVSLKPGESLEAEWVGSEWIYPEEVGNELPSPDAKPQQKFDKVRVAKMIPIKGSSQKTGLLELYIGWIQGGDVKWSPDDTQSKVRITPLRGKSGSKVDFSRLFVKYETDEGDAESVGQAAPDDPVVLN